MNRSFYLKSKVLLGFGFVLMAIIGASVVAYNSYDQLSDAVQTISRPDLKLQQIDSIMFIVGKSENSLQEYTITKSSTKLQEYDSQISDIRSRVQQLKGMSAYDESELDSILNLINAKVINMDDFMKIKERRDIFEFYDRAIEQLEKENPFKEDTVLSKDTIQVAEPERNVDSIPETIDPQEQEISEVNIEEEKKSFWKRFSKIFGRKKEVSDSVQMATESDPLTDTLSVEVDTATFSNFSVDSVRQMLNQLKREQAATEENLDRQELKYLSNNAEVMNRINELISDVKRAQQESYQSQSEEAKVILNSSLSRLGIILLVTLGSSFIFIYLIFSDIAKSDFLKSQLEKAKLHAEQLAKVKEDFLANMSHEIRTPLTAILGFTNQLKKTRLQPDQEEYLTAVDHSSSHLLALVNDILDFSKIEAGQLKFEHQVFDMKHLIEQVQRDMQFQAEKKDLQIHLEMKGEAFRYLKGDAFRLKQVLYNLVSNAIKFTEEGGVIIRCKLKSLAKGKVKAQLEVVDTGIGIPPEKQRHVFEAFVQSDVSDTRKYGGTGLGLSISKKIVESQGGEMALESEVGEGSTFYLALAYDAATQEEYLEAEIKLDPSVEKVFPDSKLLIIDDDQLNTKLLTLILEKWKIEPYVAHSGEEGLDMINNHSFDLILTDLQMPGMHGEEVASRIKAMDQISVPIVAFTARVTENKHYFEERGFSDVLHKPFNEKEVYCIIEKYLHAKAESINSLSNSFTSNEEVTEDDLFTLSNIARFIGDDQEALVAFLDSFMGVLEESTKEMQKAAIEGDIQVVAYHAHKMFPNIQQLEVTELAHLLREIEHYGQQLPEQDLLTEEHQQLEYALDEMVARVMQISEKLLAALREKKKLLKSHVS